MVKIIKGKVIKGIEHGRTIGYPTANIELQKDTLFDGTYKINILIDSEIYHGIGYADNAKKSFGAHIFDFDENIYDKEIEIIVLDKIRDNIVTNNQKDLKQQIENDIKDVKSKKNYVLTFGTFDYVHPGHKYFLEEAKKYGDKLVTILATDKNIEKFKNHKPMYDIETRKKQVQDLGVSDIIGIGDENNPLKWIELYNPKVICLGYDQIGYSKELKDYIEKNGGIEIIRIEAYKEDIYKSTLLKNDLEN